MSTEVKRGDDRWRRLRHGGFAGMVASVVCAVLSVATPPVAQAALRNAAGWGDEKGGRPDVATDVMKYVDTITTLLIWIAIPGATLGVVVAGAMFMAGERRAQSVAMGVVVGLIIVVSAKGIAE